MSDNGVKFSRILATWPIKWPETSQEWQLSHAKLSAIMFDTETRQFYFWFSGSRINMRPNGWESFSDDDCLLVARAMASRLPVLTAGFRFLAIATDEEKALLRPILLRIAAKVLPKEDA